MKRILSFIKNKIISPKYGWFGEYSNWADAENRSSGYDTNIIREKVKKSSLLVKEGKAAFERDSVSFDKIEYNFPLITYLLWIAMKENNQLKVIDFGGAFGSFYYQHRFFLEPIKKISWGVVEQESFVKDGKKDFEDDILKFYFTLNEGYKNLNPSTLLLSSVLPYIQHPYKLLESILSLNTRYIIFDKMPFIKRKDKLTIQKVDPLIYNAEYPSWFFNYEKFMDFMFSKYNLIASYNNNVPNNQDAIFMSLVFIKKNENCH